MNALAAIRQWVIPEARQPLISRAAENLPAGAIIPADQLKGVNADLGVASVNSSPAGGNSTSFGGALGNLVEEVNAKQEAANQSVNDMISGQNVSLHQTVLAMEEAGVSFQLMVEVRNKLLESYQELMRMQI
jgi:flagellar hook-basal body complex protein FliE